MRALWYAGTVAIVMAGANLWQWQFSDAEAGERLAVEKTPVEFAKIDGWAKDDHAAAFAAFRRSCTKLMALGPDEAIKAACDVALLLNSKLSRQDAQRFFEANFKPYLVKKQPNEAIVTGYFEPVIRGSLKPTEKYKVPIYAAPDDLTLIGKADRTKSLSADLTAARVTPNGLVPYYTRQEIEEGALKGRGLEIAYLADPYETFIMQVQGSGLIRLPDGTGLRVGFAGKNGHPYTSIGKILIEQGVLQAASASLETVFNWVRSDPERGRKLLWENKSYPFFRVLEKSEHGEGPHGALGLPLVPGRSLAVDPRYHHLGLPIWVSAPTLKDEKHHPFERLMIAQDTGSAIRGPVRGDIFWGSGDAAGRIAGETKNPCNFYVLIPN